MKPSFEDIPAEVLWELASLFSRSRQKKGETKLYGTKGWRKTPNARTTYQDALLRHTLRMLMGETHDEDGNRHSIAVVANAVILADLDLLGENTSDEPDENHREHHRIYYSRSGEAIGCYTCNVWF